MPEWMNAAPLLPALLFLILIGRGLAADARYHMTREDLPE